MFKHGKMGMQDPRTVSPSEGTKSSCTRSGPGNSSHKVVAADYHQEALPRHAMTIEGLQQGCCSQGLEIARFAIGATDELPLESGTVGSLGET